MTNASNKSHRNSLRRPMRRTQPGGRLWRLSGQSNTYLNSMDRGWSRSRPQLFDLADEAERPEADFEAAASNR